eukprot:scaffold34821_cov36-Tisochrysis_lutea.AAC.1
MRAEREGTGVASRDRSEPRATLGARKDIVPNSVKMWRENERNVTPLLVRSKRLEKAEEAWLHCLPRSAWGRKATDYTLALSGTMRIALRGCGVCACECRGDSRACPCACRRSVRLELALRA